MIQGASPALAAGGAGGGEAKAAEMLGYHGKAYPAENIGMKQMSNKASALAAVLRAQTGNGN